MSPGRLLEDTIPRQALRRHPTGHGRSQIVLPPSDPRLTRQQPQECPAFESHSPRWVPKGEGGEAEGAKGGTKGEDRGTPEGARVRAGDT